MKKMFCSIGPQSDKGSKHLLLDTRSLTAKYATSVFLPTVVLARKNVEKINARFVANWYRLQNIKMGEKLPLISHPKVVMTLDSPQVSEFN